MSRHTRTFLTKTGLHLALLAGSVLFAFPFVWLVTTTFKADEEVFSERINWIPKVPFYSPSSPYIDRRAYGPMRRPAALAVGAWRSLEPRLGAALWARARAVAPEDVELRPEAAASVARGLWEQLRDTLPKETLRSGPEATLAAVEKAVTPEGLKG